MKRRASREALALLPWIAAAVVWFAVVAPMRGDQEGRLSRQSRIRSDRVKAERGLREAQAVRLRISGALESVCRASSDPAALRQRAVAATAGLSLSPFTLTVTGGPEGGAQVDASGERGPALELLRRLGDPARGGFLRAASIREKSGVWAISASTGVFDSLPSGVIPTPKACSGLSAPTPADGPPAPQVSNTPRNPGAPRRASPPARPPEPAPPIPVIETATAPPFTLVAFLVSRGSPRVSIRVRDEVRVISTGDVVDGWKCVSIDRDEGVVFTSPGSERLVLKAGPPER